MGDPGRVNELRERIAATVSLGEEASEALRRRGEDVLGPIVASTVRDLRHFDAQLGSDGFPPTLHHPPGLTRPLTEYTIDDEAYLAYAEAMMALIGWWAEHREALTAADSSTSGG